MKNRLFKLFATFILIFSLGAGWLWMDFNSFRNNPIQLDDNLFFTIDKGSSLSQIARILEKQQIIRSSRYFVWQAKLAGNAHKIKAGEYELSPGMLPTELLALFVSGKVVQYSFTIIEGWNYYELMQNLAKSNDLVHTLEGLSMREVQAKLGLDKHLEGLFLPDTYHFPRNTTDVQFLKRAHKALNELLESEWQKRDKKLQVDSPYEALILASMIEKESGIGAEREKISGVFHRRLKRGMRLQSDPTIIYGIWERYDGNIRRRDIEQKTAYNTYQIDGLPPTPIAMPGRGAISAAMHPDDSKALYFVADGSGGHVFSNTLRQHNNAVIKYQLGGKARPFSSNPSP